MSLIVRSWITGIARAFAVIDTDTGRTVLVDAGPRPGTDRIAQALRRAGIAPGDVSLIILTHAHSDHTAALTELKTLTGAPLMATSRTAAALSEGRDEELVPRTRAGRFLTRRSDSENASRPVVAVEHVVDEETNLEPFGVAATAIPTPGHTAGSLSVITDNGQALIGDLVMKFLPGRPGLSFLSNDETALVSSLSMLLQRNVETFHLSHGGTVNRRSIEGAVNRAAAGR